MKKLTNEKINLLRHDARNVVRELGLLDDLYFDIGVSLAERHLLIELSSSPHPTVGDIAERLIINKSTASRLIAKAVSKGYVAYASDENDKRKRFLQFTDKGKKILNAFEPIAFKQTKEALLTLSEVEIDTVFKGIALYAKGLKNSRLRNKTTILRQNNLKLLAIYKELEKSGYNLEPLRQEDENSLYEIFREVVDSGSQFPYEHSSNQEFQRQFIDAQSHVYVCHSSSGEVVGGFYIRSNFSGRSNHIANAAYMVRGSHRGQGIGTLLVKASLHIAKDLGFKSMQFNMVFSENTVATKLYKKLGFKVIGTIPQGIRNPDGSYQDGYIMSINLDDYKT